MADNTIKIGGELESMATGKIVAAASAIKDKSRNKTQEVINGDVEAAIAEQSAQFEALLQETSAAVASASESARESKQYLADLQEAITELPDGQAVSAQVAVNEVDIAGLKSDVVVDLSTRYATSYANLSAALTALNSDTATDATAIKKSGVSIKFINSTTNKYEQWNLKASSWSTNTSDWALDVDGSFTGAKLKLPFELEKPSSNEYVTQASEIGYKGQPLDEILDEVKRMPSVHEFAVSDDNGNNIITSDDGHLKTKNFDSRSVPAHIGNTSNPHNVTKAQVGLSNVNNTSDKSKPLSDAAIVEFAKTPSNETSIHEFAIGDENGGNIFVVDDGHLKTKHFDSEDMEERVEALEEGGSSYAEVEDSVHEMAIGDDEGNNIMTFDNGHFKTKNFDSEDITERVEALEESGGDVIIQRQLTFGIPTATINGIQLYAPQGGGGGGSSDTSISHEYEVAVTWNVGYYMKTDGTIAETTSIVGNEVCDYIEYNSYMRVEHGLVRHSQGFILAALYDENHQTIALLKATHRQDFCDEYPNPGANVDYWDWLSPYNFEFVSGKSVEDAKYVRVQGKADWNTKIITNTFFDYESNPFRRSAAFGKTFAFFGGSFSVFRRVIYQNIRLQLRSPYTRAFGVGGAGFGWDSCHAEMSGGSPVMVDGKVQWLNSIPKQVERAIKYCQDNNITDGFDYWILWASTNDFNTHIKYKGSVDLTVADLASEDQYSNRDTQDGGIIWCIYRIKSLFPKAKILFFGSLPFFNARYGYDLSDTTKPTGSVIQEDGTYASRTQLNTFAEFIADQEAICSKYHIPYYNQMKEAQMNEWNYQEFYNPDDSYLHPLDAAYELWLNQQMYFIINH